MNSNKNIHQNWRELCEEAAKEQDPEKLRELVRKITDALAPKIRTRITQYDDIVPSVDDRELSATALTNLLNLKKLRTGLNPIYVPGFSLTSQVCGRFSAWRSRIKFNLGSISAPLRTIH